MKKSLARTITVALANLIDETRKEGEMCMSSMECETLEKAVEGERFEELEDYLSKKFKKDKEQ